MSNNNNNNNNNNNRSNYVSPTVPANMGGLGGLLAQMMMMSSQPKSVKCPVCQTEHAYEPAADRRQQPPPQQQQQQQQQQQTRVEDLASHNARMVFVSSSCPICLEDHVEPPMIALACGHLVCRDDFGGLGGLTGTAALLNGHQAYTSQLARAPNTTNNDDALGGIDPLQFLFGEGSPFVGGQYYHGDDVDEPDDEDEDDEDYYVEEDEEEEEDDGTDEEMPELVTWGTVAANATRQAAPTVQENSDGDDSIPDLMPQRIIHAPEMQGSSRSSSSNNNNNTASTNSSANRNTNSNANRNTNSNANLSSNTNRSNNNNNNRRPTVNSNRRSNSNNNRTATSNDDSDSDIPDLLPRSRTTAAPTRAWYDNNSNAHDSSSDDEDDLPSLIDRRGVGTANAAPASNPNDAEDDDDDMPGLLPRQGVDSDSEGESRRARNNHNTNRGSYSNNNNRSTAPAGVSSNLPRHNTPRPPNNRDSQSDDDDDDSIPDLMTRRGTQDASANSATAASRRRAASDDSSSEDSVPGLMQQRVAGQRELVPGQSEADETATAVPQAPTRELLLAEARTKVRGLRTGQLKKKLREMGVPLHGMVDKAELIEAYATAEVDGTSTNNNRSNTRTAASTTTTSSATAANRAAAPAARTAPAPAPAAPRPAPAPAPQPRPVDPFADLPALMPSKPPAANGCWTLVPKINQMEIQYNHVLNGRVESRSYRSVPKQSLIFCGLDDSCAWVYSPPSANGQSWSVHLVRHNGVHVPFYKTTAGARFAPSSRNCLWGLVPLQAGNNSSNWKLMHFSFRHNAGKLIRDNVPVSARIHPGSSDGIWLMVGREGSSASTMQPGLWYVTPTESSRILPDLDVSAKIRADAGKLGVWILAPTDDDSKMFLMHVDPTVDVKEQVVHGSFSNAHVIQDAGDGVGVYVHYKLDNRWKLCYARLNSPDLKDVCDCPRDNSIVSGGDGSLWIWRKVGRAAERSLKFIDGDGHAIEGTERFSQASVLGS